MLKESFLCSVFCESCMETASRWNSYLRLKQLAEKNVNVWDLSVQEQFLDRFLDLPGEYTMPHHVLLRVMRMRPTHQHELIDRMNYSLSTPDRFASEHWRSKPVDQLAMLLALTPEIFRCFVAKNINFVGHQQFVYKFTHLLQWVAASLECPDFAFLWTLGEPYAEILCHNAACQLDMLENPDKYQQYTNESED